MKRVHILKLVLSSHPVVVGHHCNILRQLELQSARLEAYTAEDWYRGPDQTRKCLLAAPRKAGFRSYRRGEFADRQHPGRRHSEAYFARCPAHCWTTLLRLPRNALGRFERVWQVPWARHGTDVRYCASHSGHKVVPSQIDTG